MVDVNDVPYGALYTFQPEYLGDLIHDEIHHEDDEAGVPVTHESYLARVVAFFYKA